MRALADIIGIVFWVGGLILLLAALVLWGERDSGALPFIGAGLLIAGTIISRFATSKTCPQCAESVKLEALKCKRCGHEFALH